jgi:protein-S-isoprenylcysteine O-methyltransferase Ste14
MFKRVFFFAYGVFSYLIFLGTFLYAVAFIGNFAVPRTLDGAAEGPFAISLAIDLLLLLLFAAQHSIMARKWFKDWWTRSVPKVIERSTYVLFSSLALILLFWQWRPLGGTIWSIDDPVARVALRGLFAFGWLLVLFSTFLINHFDLFGLRQVWLNLLGRPYNTLTFRTPGPYKLVRHPLYVGWLFAFWMTPVMTLAHLVFSLATTAYILLAIQFEERDLVREHGETYEDYRRAVPMLVPFPRKSGAEAGTGIRKEEPVG